MMYVLFKSINQLTCRPFFPLVGEAGTGRGPLCGKGLKEGESNIYSAANHSFLSSSAQQPLPQRPAFS